MEESKAEHRRLVYAGSTQKEEVKGLRAATADAMGKLPKNIQISRKQQILSKNAPWGSRCSEITALWILDEFLLTLGPLHALGAALLGSGQSHLEDT